MTTTECSEVVWLRPEREAAHVDDHAEKSQVGKCPDIASLQRRAPALREVNGEHQQRRERHAHGCERHRVDMPQRDFARHIVKGPDEENGDSARASRKDFGRCEAGSGGCGLSAVELWSGIQVLLEDFAAARERFDAVDARLCSRCPERWERESSRDW